MPRNQNAKNQKVKVNDHPILTCINSWEVGRPQRQGRDVHWIGILNRENAVDARMLRDKTSRAAIRSIQKE